MPFRLLSADRAGPSALGILVPPGTPTVLIVRPRSLNWDLLLIRGAADTTFQAMTQEDAHVNARAFLEALRDWSRGRRGIIQAVKAENGFVVWLDVGDFCLVACERRPGQPYQVLRLLEETEAQRIASQLAGILHPPEQTEQEVYFNSQHFSR